MGAKWQTAPDTIATPDDLRRIKSEPDGYERHQSPALGMTGLAPEFLVAVGD
jgi:hypothetical protein